MSAKDQIVKDVLAKLPPALRNSDLLPTSDDILRDFFSEWKTVHAQLSTLANLRHLYFRQDEFEMPVGGLRVYGMNTDPWALEYDYEDPTPPTGAITGFIRFATDTAVQVDLGLIWRTLRFMSPVRAHELGLLEDASADTDIQYYTLMHGEKVHILKLLKFPTATKTVKVAYYKMPVLYLDGTGNVMDTLGTYRYTVLRTAGILAASLGDGNTSQLLLTQAESVLASFVKSVGPDRWQYKPVDTRGRRRQ